MSKTAQSRHFVTGGAGFIGSRLVERLLNGDNHVTVYDNLSSGSLDNLKPLSGNANLEFIENDLLNAEALTRAMSAHQQVWHLGANSDVQKGRQNYTLDFQNNLLATFNVLEAMRLNGVQNIAFTSSSTVYGENSAGSFSEEKGPLFPISTYGAAKLGSEGFISAYSHLYGQKAVVFRLANVIGAGINRGVIRDFILKLTKNPRELEILGDGSQEKPYILVEECLDAMLLACRQTEARCEVYNIGCDSATSVTRIARIVIDEMGLPNVAVKYTGGGRGWPGDVPQVHYDVSKINRLGWSARFSSDEAVRRAVKSTLLTALPVI